MRDKFGLQFFYGINDEGHMVEQRGRGRRLLGKALYELWEETRQYKQGAEEIQARFR